MTDGRHVIVVGAGIAGLAAAYFLRRADPALRVTVLEGTDRVGGKLRVSEVAGVPVDEGAEALLLRRPEAAELARAVGLDLEDAATTSASLWTRGRLVPIPSGTVMGVPGDLRAMSRSRILTARELARIPADSWLPGRPMQDDVSVGVYVRRRMGAAVVDRLVEPMLGGVYAGRADLLSFEATLPQLAPYARQHRSLLAAVRESRDQTTGSSGNNKAVFGAPRGGVGRLPAAVATASGATVRTGAVVRELVRTATGWALTIGPPRSPEQISADAVVVAVPPTPAARLLRDSIPAAAAELAAIRTASSAVVTVALPATAFPAPPTGSGFLVPPADGRAIKAATFSSTKWGWYAGVAPGLVVVRMSVGRLDEEQDLQRDDADLVEVALADLAEAVGVTDPPVDVRVTRWGGGLPQYAVGHLGRVERIRAAVAGEPSLAVCGAAYDGIGVPACIATARRASEDLLRQWRA